MLIREGSFSEAFKVLEKLPEFNDLLPPSHYLKKMEGKKQLILVAEEDGALAGCKVAYDRFQDGSLYSWLGGVAPDFRHQQLAKALAHHQEKWAKAQGFESIRFKTLNRHKAMLIFALKNGFQIFQVKPKDELVNYRIELIKHL